MFFNNVSKFESASWFCVRKKIHNLFPKDKTNKAKENFNCFIEVS